MRFPRQILPVAATLLLIPGTGCYMQHANALGPNLPKANIASIDSAFAPLPDAPNEPPEKVALGLALFREKRLSGDRTIACASCHDLNAGGSDHVALSRGVRGQTGGANTPTVFNSSLNFRQFWDGRAADLADQITGPLTDPKEMASGWDQVLQFLRESPEYRDRFRQIFGEEPSRANVTEALVSFENSLLTPNSPFDRFLQGETHALAPQQRRGYQKFRAFGCVACHQGVNVGGNMYQSLGLLGDYFHDRGGSFPSDEGRFRVTGNPVDRHVFRVPSLRNVALTAPYFHDGQVATLEQAVRNMAKYQLGRKLSGEDTADIVAFLHSLTGERPKCLEPSGKKE